jgi:hypothetical protein
MRIAVGSFMIAGSAFLTAACAGEDAALAPYPGGFVVAKSRFGNGVVRGQGSRAGFGW